MDFLEDLLGDRSRRGRGGFFQNGNQGHHDDDHDDHDDHDHHRPYPTNSPYPQAPASAAGFMQGAACRKCSTPTVPGAKFCHGCGALIEVTLNCASCGSKLPENALFCAQCGYKNG